MGLYVTVTMVDEYLSPAAVRDTFDDDNDGATDPGALERIIATSEALVGASLRGVYAMPLAPPLDPLVVAVTLMVVKCQACRRHPERWKAHDDECKAADALLVEIRKGQKQLAHPLRSGARVADVLSEKPRGIGELG